MIFDPIEAGKRIKKIRKAFGYTQIQFAEKLNVSRGFYSKVEIGLQIPSVYLLVELSELAGVSLDYLILGKKQDHSQLKHDVHDLISSLQQFEKEL